MITRHNIFLDTTKQKARIENWYLTTNLQGVRVLVGQIKDHPRQEEFYGELQITSPVVSYDPENDCAETENTIYLLGTPAVMSALSR